MQWYVTTSLACCGSTLVASLGFLALSSFYVFDSKKNIPSDTTDIWMHHVEAFLGATVLFALTCIGAAWVIISKTKRWFLYGAMCFNFVCFGLCVYGTVAFQLQYDRPKLKADELFREVKKEIQDHLGQGNTGKYIPTWLDSIQNKSKECCGIQTFRDWEEFWPTHQFEIPKSCCKEPNNAEKCLTNLITIPFPGVPSMFIKTDTGCIEDINAHMRKNIHDCFIYMIILAILFGLTQIAYIIQFCVRPGAKYSNYADDVDDSAGGDGIPPIVASGGPGNRFLGFFGFKKQAEKNDVEGGTPYSADAGELYDVNGTASGSLASGYTASQGTLPDSASQGPFYGDRQFPGESGKDLASAASSGSDIDIDSSSPGVTGSEIKKKKKKKHKKQKQQQDDMVGSDGADGKVNRQEVFVVPDNVPPPTTRNDYDYQAANQSNDILAMNGYDATPAPPPPNAASPTSGSPPVASPSASSDEVGDKLAPGVKSASKKDKLMGFLTHKKK